MPECCAQSSILKRLNCNVSPSLHSPVRTRPQDNGLSSTAIDLTQCRVVSVSNVQYPKSHDLAMERTRNKRFTYRQTSLPGRLAHSSAHKDLSGPSGTCRSLVLAINLMMMMLLQRLTRSRVGRLTMPLRRTAVISRALAKIAICWRDARCKVWEGRWRGGDGLAAGRLAKIGWDTVLCTEWDLWRTGRLDRCGRSVQLSVSDLIFKCSAN
jgi:hypothetical protein